MDYLEGPHEIFHFNITQLIMHYRPIKYEDITLNKHNEVFSGPSPGSIIRNRRDEWHKYAKSKNVRTNSLYGNFTVYGRHSHPRRVQNM